MDLAILEAKKAERINEIPVGCIIVMNDNVIASGYNCKESEKNSIRHAEINAIDEACRKLNTWRLDDCVMYVTLEPCMMCMGAIVESRIKVVYYGTKNNVEQMYDNSKICKRVNLINARRYLLIFLEKEEKSDFFLSFLCYNIF